jgi:hypothetical protein
MPKLKLSLFQLDRLIRSHAPSVYRILQAKEITPELFSVQWFVTLFAYDVGLPDITLIWDLFFLKGWKFILKLSLAIVMNLPANNLHKESELIISLLKNSLQNTSILDIIKKALKIKITKKELSEIEDEYKGRNKETKRSLSDAKTNIDEPNAEVVYVFPMKADFIRKHFCSGEDTKRSINSEYKKKVRGRVPCNVRRLAVNLSLYSGHNVLEGNLNETIESEKKVKIHNAPIIIHREFSCNNKTKDNTARAKWCSNKRYRKVIVDV